MQYLSTFFCPLLLFTHACPVTIICTLCYVCVIVYVRVFEGTVRPGDTIKLMNTGATFQLVEVGHMGATALAPCDKLEAGEVGYLTASIKTVRDTRVGDTITLAEAPTAEALPGFRQVTPMVFCGIYPADGADYPDLKDALEKLQLNDAALSFEPETSAALGFGFRCGFLGLLHMEIITERLEREFDLDLITTTPGVQYRLTLTDGTVEVIDNPSAYPDPARIAKAEEPFVDAHIYTPNDYVGPLMDLCQQKRGTLIAMDYLENITCFWIFSYFSFKSIISLRMCTVGSRSSSSQKRLPRSAMPFSHFAASPLIFPVNLDTST